MSIFFFFNWIENCHTECFSIIQPIFVILVGFIIFGRIFVFYDYMSNSNTEKAETAQNCHWDYKEGEWKYCWLLWFVHLFCWKVFLYVFATIVSALITLFIRLTLTLNTISWFWENKVSLTGAEPFFTVSFIIKDLTLNVVLTSSTNFRARDAPRLSRSRWPKSVIKKKRPLWRAVTFSGEQVTLTLPQLDLSIVTLDGIVLWSVVLKQLTSHWLWFLLLRKLDYEYVLLAAKTHLYNLQALISVRPSVIKLTFCLIPQVSSRFPRVPYNSLNAFLKLDKRSKLPCSSMKICLSSSQELRSSNLFSFKTILRLIC